MRARLRIERLVHGGTGLARHGDAAVFVPFVLPGEEVDVEISHRGGVARGVPVGWTERSADRVEPPCPVFGKCGGCHYQHIPYERQREFKQAVLRETLRRIGGLEWDREIAVESAEPWGYRNRTQLRFDRRGGVAETGFFSMRSHELVAADECAINSPALNRAHTAVREMIADKRFPKQLRQIELFTNESDLQLNLPRRPGPLPKRFWSWCAERLGVLGPGEPLTLQSGGDAFRVSGRSFFQVNRHLTARLAELAVGEAGGDVALDLYCGVGLLTLPLSRRFRKVIGVDSAGSAAHDLQSNAAKAGFPVRSVHMDVADFLAGYEGRADLVVADPPRAGLEAAVVDGLLRLAPPEIRLVSCDPATLARDLKRFVAGGYGLTGLAVVDLFPQTYHVETLANLRRT